MLQGRQEGIHESQRQYAQKMLAEGLNLSMVKRITGLSEKELAE